jgi:hypothetical protein
MAFIDEDGDVIALWAGFSIGLRQTGVITYLVDHVLQFGGVDDGVVIVTAPDDELFDFAVTTGIAIANLQLQQLRQAEINSAEHSA